MTAAIAIKDLVFTYPHQKQPTLAIQSLTVEAGQHMFLKGPSGSGKTTLLGILTGILSDYQGSVQVHGQELKNLASSERDRFRGEAMGYIFQMFNLIPYLTARENIELPCRFNQSRQARLTESMSQELLRICQHLEIDHVLDKPVTELSVGQQQRVAAARALIGTPPLVVADEPTSALDTQLRTKFIKLLIQEASSRQQTIFFVSHDESLEVLFDQVLSLPELNQVTV